MRPLLNAILLLSIAAVSCTPKPRPISVPESEPTSPIRPATNDKRPAAEVVVPCAKAVAINAANDSDGIKSENAWLAKRYPGYKKVSQSLSSSVDHTSKKPSRWFDEIEVVTVSGEHISICFDITSFYGRW